MLFRTERSAHLRVALSRESLRTILLRLPIDLDAFLIDDLADETLSLDEVLLRHWGESRATCCTGSDAEVYLLARGEEIDVIVISYGVAGSLESVLALLEEVTRL